jgi:TRAP-type mannitol/chloroaromatic compound transport system substrate-binding protein
MSNGRLNITVYGGGEMVPPLEVFDAVSQGIAEMGHGASYYWAGKTPASQFFCSVPFGMNAQQQNSWLYSGGGIELWRELYAKFNLIPFPAGNTGGQMGGWFNKEINSPSDLKGLKIRMPGLGGKIISKAGAASILSPGSELYTNLERGVIDALEWVGPYHDYLMGFHKIAKYYYYPGWQEPGAILEMLINKSAFESLPEDLKEILEIAAADANIKMLSEFEVKNREYFLKMKNEGINFRLFPAPVISRLKELSDQVYDEIISSDEMSRKIFTSYKEFQDKNREWNFISENQSFHYQKGAAEEIIL